MGLNTAAGGNNLLNQISAQRKSSIMALEPYSDAPLYSPVNGAK